MPEHILNFRSTPRLMPAALAVVLALFLLGGCTSDAPDNRGMGLVETTFEIELEPIEISNTTMYSAMDVSDADVPLDQQEVLYMGSQGGNSSSILVNFNFDDLYTEEIPDTMFTAEHITSVNMRLLVLKDYHSIGAISDTNSADKGLAKDFLVFQLEAPFDSTAFPGPEPAYYPNAWDVSTDPDPGNGDEISIQIYEAEFLLLLQEGGLQGFIITEGNATEEGLVGYSSRDLTHGGTALNPVHENTTLGVVLQISFDTNAVMAVESVADISTFHEVSDIPSDPGDGFFVRSVLRSYPALMFDYSSLPENVFVNRAVLQVVNDPTVSFGHVDGVIISEMDPTYFGDPFKSLDLEELDEQTTSFGGMGNLGLDPVTDTYFQFNVTTSIQRVVNEAYDGDRGFIFTGPESFHTNYPALNPDIYFFEYHFHGTNDPDPDLRPKLKITYSTVGEFLEGGAR